jgi:WhiB family redox-sensing transcriptional regulator
VQPSRRHHLQPFVWQWEWQSLGNCVGQSGEAFFPEDSPRGDRRRLEQQAKVICAGCPVQARCLEHALNTPEPYGVWGAMTATERGQRDLRRRANTPGISARSRALGA